MGTTLFLLKRVGVDGVKRSIRWEKYEVIAQLAEDLVTSDMLCVTI